MKKVSWLVGVVALAVAAMGTMFGLQSRELSRDLAKVDGLRERIEIEQDLQLALEKYRRTSGSFRKMDEGQIASAKSGLRVAVNKAVDRLAGLEPSPEEAQAGTKLEAQLEEFFKLSAKLEPMLFLRDVFLKPEAQAAHADMLKTVESMLTQAHSRWSDHLRHASSKQSAFTRTFVLSAIIVLGAAGAWVAILFLWHIRPLRRLRERVLAVQAGKLRRDDVSTLGGEYREVESCLDQLAETVASARGERRSLMHALVTDLRVPILPLQSGAMLLASQQSDTLEPTLRRDTAEGIRRGAIRLSRSLDDLMDLLPLEEGDLRLEEKMVDLREVAQAAAKVLSGPGAAHEIRVYLPPQPLWARIDPARLERVMVSLLSKVMQYSPQGGKIDLAVSRPVRAGQPQGAEILIHESGPASSQKDPSQHQPIRASSPEQSLSTHWVSENGFGLILAERLVDAHGGQLTASGLAGTSVIFTLRLPEDRLAGQSQLGRPGFRTTGASAPASTVAPTLHHNMNG